MPCLLQSFTMCCSLCARRNCVARLHQYQFERLYLVPVMPRVTHALYISFTHLSSVMFKHYQCSIHFQQYQFNNMLKPTHSSYHLEMMLFTFAIFFDVKVAVLIMPFHYLCRTTTGVATIFYRG